MRMPCPQPAGKLRAILRSAGSAPRNDGICPIVLKNSGIVMV
jgi:hypothetical protein